MATVIHVPSWVQRPFSEELDTPMRLTLLRKAAWAAILVPTCSCKEREFQEKKNWLCCTKCGKPARMLDGVEQLAPTIDEALSIALARVESES